MSGSVAAKEVVPGQHRHRMDLKAVADSLVMAKVEVDKGGTFERGRPTVGAESGVEDGLEG